MKTSINITLTGSPLPGLTQYGQERSNDPFFSFCLNSPWPVGSSSHFPDVLFINCSRDHLFGLRLLSKIKRLSPATQVVLAVSPANIKIGRHAIGRGALAYIIKGEHEPQQVHSIMALCKTLLCKPAAPVRRPWLRPGWLPWAYLFYFH